MALGRPRARRLWPAATIAAVLVAACRPTSRPAFAPPLRFAGADGRPAGAAVVLGASAGQHDSWGGDDDVYRQFLAVARSDGVEAAMCHAADSMPKAFCLNGKSLRKAAKFVAELAEKERKAASANATADASGAAAETAPEAAAPPPPAASPCAGSAALQVCRKCLNRQRKKGIDFDLPAALASQLGEGSSDIRVEPTGCLKACKRGPNVRVVLGVDTEASIAPGMTQQEEEDRCFEGVSDAAAAGRVVELTRQLLGGGGDSSAAGAAAAESAPPPEPPEAPGAAAGAGRQQAAPPELQRDRVRRSVEDRIARLTADLEMEEDVL